MSRYSNALDEHLPEEIGDMTMLMDLRLQDNNITGTIPDTIGKLLRLRCRIGVRTSRPFSEPLRVPPRRPALSLHYARPYGPRGKTP